ncbi:MAG: NADPH:quinone oxidoreductase family protein [Actinomycetota bacterium]
MKAIVCKELSGPESLVVEELPSPLAPDNGVVISVQAAGVNFPDILITQGKYQFKPEPPFVPGHEAAGTIKEVGSGVTAFKPGDRVIAFTGVGAFAQEIACDQSVVIPMPNGMDYETGAGFTLAYGTSQYALRDRGRLKENETLLVLGASGGVGLAAVEIGRAIGANVIAAASTDEKLEVCRKHGANETINYETQDLKTRVKEITGGKGVDVIYDPVGGKYAEPALRTIGWDGRYLVVGFAAGDIPKIPLNLTLLKSCSIVGVFWGAFARAFPKRNSELIAELMKWWSEGKISPFISEVYSMDRAADALNDVANRKVRGKAIIKIA